MSNKDPIAALHEVAEANRQTAVCMQESARSQQRGAGAMTELGRAVREMAQINLRSAAIINALCDSVQVVNRDIKSVTSTAVAVAASIDEQEQKLRSIIAPVTVDEPATLSLTSDAVAFSPEEDEFIERKIRAIDPAKLQLN